MIGPRPQAHLIIAGPPRHHLIIAGRLGIIIASGVGRTAWRRSPQSQRAGACRARPARRPSPCGTCARAAESECFALETKVSTSRQKGKRRLRVRACPAPIVWKNAFAPTGTPGTITRCLPGAWAMPREQGAGRTAARRPARRRDSSRRRRRRGP